MRSGRANPSASGQIWMIRRFTSAQFVPADAGSKDKNPMGSALLSTPIIAPTNLDRHQILRNFCHESVRKGLKVIVSPILKMGPSTISMVGTVAATARTLMACEKGDITASAWAHTPLQL
jgi:hypothetical protein